MSRITLYEGTTPPAAPPSGVVYLYPKSDGRWYFMADDGIELAMRPTGAGTGDLLADGSVPLTANWDVGAFTITGLRFVSDVPTGTAPFTVSSTTLVAGLNADQLDGNEATAFATAAQGATADTALQPAAIGSTVQGWSAVLDATTASFLIADETKLDGIDPIASVQSNLAASIAPTTTDDTNAGYAVGSSWWDTTNDEVYLCIDATAAAAVWKQVGSGTGGGITALVKTGNYTANAGEIIGVGSDTAAITITLPATPSANAYVGVWDADDNALTNNITIARNGSTIDGVAEDGTINVNGGRFDLIYDGTTWKTPYATPGASAVEFAESQTVTRTAGDLTTTSSTFVDATGMSITMTTGAVRCLIIVNANGTAGSAAQNVAVDVDIDGTRLGQDYGMAISLGVNNTPLSFQALTDVLTAGSHTFKLQFRSAGGTTAKLLANTTNCPLKMTVIETRLDV